MLNMNTDDGIRLILHIHGLLFICYMLGEINRGILNLSKMVRELEFGLGRAWEVRVEILAVFFVFVVGSLRLSLCVSSLLGKAVSFICL